MTEVLLNSLDTIQQSNYYSPLDSEFELVNEIKTDSVESKAQLQPLGYEGFIVTPPRDTRDIQLRLEQWKHVLDYCRFNGVPVYHSKITSYLATELYDLCKFERVVAGILESAKWVDDPELEIRSDTYPSFVFNDGTRIRTIANLLSDEDGLEFNECCRKRLPLSLRLERLMFDLYAKQKIDTQVVFPPEGLPTIQEIKKDTTVYDSEVLHASCDSDLGSSVLCPESVVEAFCPNVAESSSESARPLMDCAIPVNPKAVVFPNHCRIGHNLDNAGNRNFSVKWTSYKFPKLDFIGYWNSSPLGEGTLPFSRHFGAHIDSGQFIEVRLPSSLLYELCLYWVGASRKDFSAYLTCTSKCKQMLRNIDAESKDLFLAALYAPAISYLVCWKENQNVNRVVTKNYISNSTITGISVATTGVLAALGIAIHSLFPFLIPISMATGAVAASGLLPPKGTVKKKVILEDFESITVPVLPVETPDCFYKGPKFDRIPSDKQIPIRIITIANRNFKPVVFQSNSTNEYAAIQKRVIGVDIPNPNYDVLRECIDFARNPHNLRLLLGSRFVLSAWSFERWIKGCNASVSVKERYKKTFLELESCHIDLDTKLSIEKLKQWTIRSSFVKVEKNNYTGMMGTSPKAPRLIQGATPEMTVCCGRWVAPMCGAIKKAINRLNQIKCTAGLENETVANWFVDSDVGNVFGSEDFGSFDVTQDPLWSEAEAAWLDWYGAPTIVKDLHRANVQTSGRTTWGWKYTIDGKRKSGDVWTSKFNELINIFSHLFVLTKTTGLTLDQVLLSNFRLAVCGDDAIVRFDRSVDRLSYPLIFKQLGFKLETNWSNSPVGLEYCSTNLYPIHGGYTFAPCVGKLLAKVGWTMLDNDCVDYRAVTKATMLSMYNNVSCLPPLKSFFDRILKEFSDVPLVHIIDEPHKMKSSRPCIASSDTWAALYEIYGWTSNMQEQWDTQLLEQEIPGYLDSTLFDLLCDRDVVGDSYYHGIYAPVQIADKYFSLHGRRFDSDFLMCVEENPGPFYPVSNLYKEGRLVPVEEQIMEFNLNSALDLGGFNVIRLYRENEAMNLECDGIQFMIPLNQIQTNVYQLPTRRLRMNAALALKTIDVTFSNPNKRKLAMIDLVGIEPNPGPPKKSKKQSQPKVARVVKKVVKKIEAQSANPIKTVVAAQQKNITGQGKYKMTNSGRNPYTLGGIGAYLGGGIGDLTSALLSKITGMGAYQVQSNTIDNGTVPTFAMVSNGIEFSYREYVSDVAGSTAFNSTVYAVNPANATLFSWLSAIAGNFQLYSFKGLVFEFKSTSADALNSTNTALGTVIMGTQYNSYATPFANKRDMENSEFAVSTKPSCSVLHAVECKPGDLVQSKYYVSPSGAAAAGSDIRLVDHCNFTIATVGMQAAAVIGELWVTYHIRLILPETIDNVSDIDTSGAQHLLGYQNTTATGGNVLLKFWTSGTNFLPITTTDTISAGVIMKSKINLLTQQYSGGGFGGSSFFGLPLGCWHVCYTVQFNTVLSSGCTFNWGFTTGGQKLSIGNKNGSTDWGYQVPSTSALSNSFNVNFYMKIVTALDVWFLSTNAGSFSSGSFNETLCITSLPDSTVG